jgi:hypothetical protein
MTINGTKGYVKEFYLKFIPFNSLNFPSRTASGKTKEYSPKMLIYLLTKGESIAISLSLIISPFFFNRSIRPNFNELVKKKRKPLLIPYLYCATELHPLLGV